MYCLTLEQETENLANGAHIAAAAAAASVPSPYTPTSKH